MSSETTINSNPNIDLSRGELIQWINDSLGTHVAKI